VNPGEYRQMYDVEEYHWWYVSLHELIIPFVRSMKEATGALRILDAGCGTGRLCVLLDGFGAVSGCDMSNEAIELCRTRGLKSVFQADLNSVSFRSSHYDVITSIDTLYHLGIDDELAVLKKFHGALKPGGMLIINLVAHEFLRSTHDIAVHTRKRYNRKEVETLLESSGFKIRISSYRLGFLFLPIAALRLMKKLLNFCNNPGLVKSDVTSPNKALNRLLLWAARQENRFVLKSAVPLGTSVFAVAQKPLSA
jgi:SAM-dependent methyltransferase